MSRFSTALFAVILACAAATLHVSAATTGVVRGSVTLDGRPAAGASLTLEGEGSKFSTKADAQGAYVFAQVPFGSYRVIARATNGRELQTIVTVSSDTVATINFPLTTQLTEIARTTVTARAGVQANPPSVNQINRAAIAASPVQNSLSKILATLPGVIPFSYNEPVINGFHGVTYNIDGAPLPLATTSNFAEIVDPKNIDSVELLTGAIPAEYGGDRMGGVVNIITNRPSDLPPGIYGSLTGGAGNQAQRIGSLDTSARFGASELFFNVNSQSTSRGLDSPTFDPIHDASSQSDQFVRFLTQLSPRATLAFDYSNQLAQFQIPINTDPNNPYDPIVSVPGTDDVQREYDRFSNLNLTQTSRDGNGIFQIVPWWRSTRIDYDGDVSADVLGVTGIGSQVTHNVGLLSHTYASYVGLRASDFRATEHHAWKVGIDVNRSNLLANQAFACYYPNCADSGTRTQPYYLATSPQQTQAGSQVGIYAQDKWQMSNYVQLSYGLRYDHSTGYTSGWQISPRAGITVWDGGKNTAHAYYGRFYAAPLLEDVRQDCVVLQGCPTTPLYDLQPERDAYYEIGVEHAFSPDFTGSLNIFRKTVVNILDTTQLLNTPLFAVFNNAIGLDSGLEMRLNDRLHNGNSWFLTATVSGSYAACISGSTFLFPPGTNTPNQSCVSQLSPEDHDETVAASAAYTWRFGAGRNWFTTLQGDYGSGFPVQFETATTSISGRLPAHTTFDVAAGRSLTPGRGQADRGLGLSFIVTNLLNHQYPIKIANGFNTTQIANGRTVLLRLTAPF